MTFLDIFSRKKPIIKEESKEKIIIDYREKNCLVGPELKSMGFDIEYKELKVADYLVKGVAIERKTVNDFISSMINKRLLNQLEELQQYSKKLLIIEGIDEQELYTDSKKITGMHPNSIRGFLLSILLKYNVPIIYTKNYKDTAKFISVLSKKKETDMPLNVNKKTLTKKERLQFILESFQGIGPKTAIKLLKKFKTLNGFINASEEDLKEIIGKKAESLFELIHSKY